MKINKEVLETEYLQNYMSVRKIAKKYKMSKNTVKVYMKQFNILIRNENDPIVKKQKIHISRDHFRWKGGVAIRNNRAFILCKNHPRANSGYVLRSMIVAEKKIGRRIRKNENIHHINKNTLDDNPENLKVMTIRQHHQLHDKKRKRNKLGKYI